MAYRNDGTAGCVDCGSTEIGPRSLRCVPCKAIAQRAYTRSWAGKNREHVAAYGKARYDADPESQRRRSRDYRAANPEKTKELRDRLNRENGRRYYLKSAYGLTVEQFDALVAAQDGRCAICGRDGGGTSATRRSREWLKGLVVDHDHLTGDVRGLLCQPCNLGVGNFQDDPALMRKAIAYIEQSRQPAEQLQLFRLKGVRSDVA